jgi:MFS family permease
MAVSKGAGEAQTLATKGPSTPVSMGRQFSMNIFWFGNNFHWQALLAIVIPSQVAKLLGESDKALNLTLVVLWGTIIAIITNPLAGALSDYAPFRMGRRRPFMIAGTFFNVLILIALAFAPASVIALAILFLLLQFFNNFANAPWSAIIADQVPEKQRGSASGWYGLLTLLGTVLGAVVAGVLLNQRDPLAIYRIELLRIYTIIAALQIVCVVATVLLVPEQPLTERKHFSWRQFFARFQLHPRKYPDFTWVLFTRLLMMMGIWSIYYFLQYYFSDVLGVKDAEATVGALFLPIVMVAAVLTVYTAGALSDRIGRKKLVYIAGTMMTIVALIFIFMQTLTASLVAAAFFGLGYGAYTSVDWALATDALPPTDQYGKDMGIWNTAGIIPQVIGITAGGVILTLLKGFPHHLGYTALFALTVLFFFLGTFFIRQVKGVR